MIAPYKTYRKVSTKLNDGKILIFLIILLQLFETAIAQSVPDIIFTEVPAKEINFNYQDTDQFDPGNRYEGSRILKLRQGMPEPVNLTPGFYSAADPEISFDANYVIFSGKKMADDYWQIWKMNIDGSDKIQITNASGDCVMPVFSGSRFYLDDPAPTPQIIYAGTAHNWKNNIESGSVYSLYGTDMHGKATHRLTFNLYSDFAPAVLPNGRIAYSSMQPSENQNSSLLKMAFFAINIDGTDLMPYYGNHDKPLYKNEIHISAEDKSAYFIESQSPDFYGGGKIAYVSHKRPLHSYRSITHASTGYYKSPYALGNGKLIVSYRSNKANEVYALYRFNPETGKREEELFSAAGWHCLDAQAIQKRDIVKGRSNWLIPGKDSGVFYCLDTYESSYPREFIKPGDIRFVRLIEGLPLKPDKTDDSRPEKNITDMKVAPARIIGTAAVEKDGSFHVRVPANIPVSFQILDKNKMAIDRQKTWTWVIGNENRGCIGCHEDRELTPENKMVEAVLKPAVDLTGKFDQKRTVDFLNQIAPIVQSKCAVPQCHISGGVHPALEIKSQDVTSMKIYNTLLNKKGVEKGAYYIKPGFARLSPLIRHLSGKYALPDTNIYLKSIDQMQSHFTLTHEEQLLFIEWIDLGAQWDLSHISKLNTRDF